MLDLFDLSNNILNDIVKYAVLHICTYIAYTKIVNYKEKSKKFIIIKFSILILLSITLSYIYVYVNLNINPYLPFFISWLTMTLLIKIFTHKRFINTFLTIIPSFVISYGAWVLSAIIMTTILYNILNIRERNFLHYIIIDVLIIIFTNLLFKIKRFKSGFLVLQEDDIIETIGIVGITISGIFLYIFFMFKTFENFYQLLASLVLLIMLGICSFIWHKRSQEIFYRDELRDRNNLLLSKKLKETEEERDSALEEVFRVSQISHGMNHRIKILESVATDMASIPAVTKKFKRKYGRDFDVFLDDIKISSQEYLDAVSNICKKRKLPLTNIFEIDTVFEYMQLEAQKKKIILELKINGSVNYIIDKKLLTINQLRTLLSDHITDSIIAINSSENKYRKIFIILGLITTDCYGIKIYDSGIEFPIDILVNLGLKAVTSYTNGSGQGFMTTFATIKNKKGSIVIEENNPQKSNYTKSVGIIFDNKDEYRIDSYRAKDIRIADKKQRIIVKNIKNK